MRPARVCALLGDVRCQGIAYPVVCAGCAGIGVKCNGGSCVCSGGGAEVLLSYRVSVGCWLELLALLVMFKCCCTRLGVYHWYVLKGGAIPTFKNVPMVHT